MKQAACVLIVRDDKVLAVNRPNDPTQFCLPGGNIEEGEPYALAASRELFEETGIAVLEESLILLYHGGSDDEEYETTTFIPIVMPDVPSVICGDCGVAQWVDWQTIESSIFGKYNKCVHEEYNRYINEK